MRVACIDSVSNLLDRLITERIKEHLFEQNGAAVSAEHQRQVVAQIRSKLSAAFQEVFEGKYRSIVERRTYSATGFEVLIKQLEALIKQDLILGGADHLKLTLAKEVLVSRRANECRAEAKDQLERVVLQIGGQQ